MEKNKKSKVSVEINNRKARHDYEFVVTYTAGIVLTGTEIKSIRAGKASIVDAYCYIDSNNEIWMKQSFVAKYEQGNPFSMHDENRQRKLLLNKKEITDLKKKVEEKGYTIVPYKMFISERGLCKVNIALAKGKHDYDKRQAIKERDSKRELDSIMKQYK